MVLQFPDGLLFIHYMYPLWPLTPAAANVIALSKPKWPHLRLPVAIANGVSNIMCSACKDKRFISLFNGASPFTA